MEFSRECDGASLQRLLTLFASQGDYAIIFLDRNGIVLGVNAAAERILGYALDELRGAPLRRIFTEEDIALELDRHELRVACQQGFSEDDRWHVRKDGLRIWSSGMMTALHEQGTLVGFIKVLRDRTDLKARIDALQNRLLEESRRVREKVAVIGTLGHELRNPVHALDSALSLLRRLLSANDSAQAALDAADRQLGIFARLVDDLTDSVGAEIGALKLQIEPVNLQAALRAAMASRSDSASRRGVALRSVLPEPTIVLEADPVRLAQIFGNLLDNAIKYTQAGGNVWVTATVEGSSAVVRVRDDGDGIPPDTLPRIFDMFTRDTKAVAMADGLGIGLAVVKNLVQLHRGTVEVRLGGEGSGTEFAVNLPLDAPIGDE